LAAVEVTRATRRHLAVASVLVLALGCGGQTPGTGHGSQAIAEFARVRAARAEFVAAREALDRVQAEAREGRADAEAVRRAQSAFNAAYTRDQKALAAFLTVALNERPGTPETREALGLYAEAAVANARLLLVRDGNARRAAEVLHDADRLFRALNLPVPNDLAAALVEARRAQASPSTATPTPPRASASLARPHRRTAGSRRQAPAAD
jgi:hypothetical protein